MSTACPAAAVPAYSCWTELLRSDPTPGGLVRFHTVHKLTLMAHSPKHYAELGRLVAKAGTVPWSEPSDTYGRLFMEGLALLGTRRKHVNVLQHLMGYLYVVQSGAAWPRGLWLRLALRQVCQSARYA
jgi:uncharacterized protein YbgA (DUF1722 family)